MLSKQVSIYVQHLKKHTYLMTLIDVENENEHSKI